MDSNSQSNITRTKEEAISILRTYQQQITDAGDDYQKAFASLAHEHSDCSSFSKGGDLGWFGRNQMQRPFEEATFALDVGKVSDVVSTDSGVHLILRTG
jgi:NIMA-interacting peptidyl-prolyl cis-trans isomerase 1